MTKKILLSVAASALLTTAAYAGTISLTSLSGGLNANGHTNLAIESFQQNGMDELNLQNLEYKVTLAGNAISDPTLYLNIGDLEFPFHLDATGAQVAGFDEDGKGILGKNLDGVAAIMEALLKDQVLLDTDPVTSTVSPTDITYHSIVTVDGKTYATFDGDASDNMYNGHIYSFASVDSNGANINAIPFKFPANINGTQLVDQKLELFLESLTVTPNFQDEANENYTTNLIPQFSVKCKAKMDGLINWENDRLSFVNAPHGARTGTTGLNSTSEDGQTDTMIASDSMVFVVENQRQDDNNATRWMSGAGSLFTFQADNLDNNFTVAGAEWEITLNGTPSTDGTLDRTAVLPAADGMLYDEFTNTFAIYTAGDKPLPIGTTDYKVDFLAKPGTIIKPVNFLNPTVDLEGALQVIVDSNVSSLIDLDDNSNDANGPENAHNYVVPTSGDGTTPTDNNESDAGYATILPAADTLPRKTDLGAWIDHAYVAQIAGATQNPGVVESKFFIVNRSCAVATPTFKLIQDGKVAIIKGDPIAVDSQAKVKMADLVASPEAVAAGMTGTQFAVEIILGGVAEDFYIYAQSLTSAGATKDLPVYNTSNRD